MSSLADKVLALHQSLDEADFPHAFGGALALGWCTRQPRATSDFRARLTARKQTPKVSEIQEQETRPEPRYRFSSG